ncbi:MAG TPA: endonuclease MutS2 [Syntrophomonadaceae bacterium]|nr:endonuclease MutS2 [Syntrophomonadaceae bacterium]
MDKKTLKKLEFDIIQTRLSELTYFEGGFNHVMEMVPLSDYELVLKRLDETEEAMEFLRYEEPTFFSNLNLIYSQVKKARVRGILNAHELLDIYYILKASRIAKKSIDPDKYKQLGLISFIIEDNYGLQNMISKAITEDGEVRDDATPQLRSIRSQINTYKNRIREYLQSFIRSEHNQKKLQDVLITERDGRYVIPVKQEYRYDIRGIIHDESASGATVFVEPISVVEHNNKIRSLQLEEKREIEKLLLELSSEVALIGDDLLNNLQCLSLLDYIFARGKLAYKQNAFRPIINHEGIIEINRGKHPLIGEDAVPLNVEIGKKFDVLVITGPNTGGKTVALKTIGLLSVMAMCGLFIPAREGSKISIFKSIYVDIGDEQSIEQSLSTFSSHMKNIIDIIDKADNNSLVLLDELGAGTDPTEGASLARVILEKLQAQKAKVVVSTHQSELKNFAYQTERVENACVEFDPVSLSPTYELTIGTPGQSNAFEIANRLGLKQELVNRAKELVPETDREISEMIRDLKDSRYKYNTLVSKLELDKEIIEKEKKELTRLKQEFFAQEEQVLKKAREEADSYLRGVKAEADTAIKEFKEVLKNQDISQDKVTRWHEIEESKQKLKNISIPKPTPKFKKEYIKSNDKAEIKLGDYVFIKSIKQKGYVLEKMQDDFLVQVGILKINVDQDDVMLSESPEARQSKMKNDSFLHKAKSISKEIDLRGKLAEEAIEEIDKYLDDASLVSLDSVRIIHGKGTGALRKAVRAYLKNHHHVKEFRDGHYNEGGFGVTVVELK